MVWARQNGFIVEPKLIETFGLSSHIVALHLSDGETIADIEPCLQGGCEVIYDREHRRALGRAPILPIFGIDSPAH